MLEGHHRWGWGHRGAGTIWKVSGEWGEAPADWAAVGRMLGSQVRDGPGLEEGRGLGHPAQHGLLGTLRSESGEEMPRSTPVGLTGCSTHSVTVAQGCPCSAFRF